MSARFTVLLLPQVMYGFALERIAELESNT
jgi:hypothetical protein